MYETLSEKQIARQNSDKRKSTYLTNKGWVVLRFWQSELIQKGYDQVTNAIDHIISQRKGTTC